VTSHDVPTRYRVDERKYPDRFHWQFAVNLLGEDEHGMWFHVPPRTPAMRGSEPRMIERGFVALAPVNDPWIAEFYMDSPTEQIYVNIGTVPTIAKGVIRQIDLDLDVILTADGEVVVADEEEFAQRQVEFGYPRDLIEAAIQAAEDAVHRLTNRLAPFDGAADPWLEAAGSAAEV